MSQLMHRGHLVLALVALGAVACSTAPPSPDRFRAVPVACDLVSEQTVRDLTGGAAAKRDLAVEDKSTSCHWTYSSDSGSAPEKRTLRVKVTWFKAPAGQTDITGARLAEREFGTQRTRLGMDGKGSLQGLGNDAYAQFFHNYGEVDFRRDNVTVSVVYEAAAIVTRSGLRLPAGLGEDVMREPTVRAATEVDSTLSR
jgi:hypothetical protein